MSVLLSASANPAAMKAYPATFAVPSAPGLPVDGPTARIVAPMRITKMERKIEPI